VNGPAADIASSGPTGVHSLTVPSQSTPVPADAHRSSQSQSVISVDETVPYSRGVDRSELLSSKSLSLLVRLACAVVVVFFNIFSYSFSYSE